MNSESEAALKKIVRIGLRSNPTRTGWDKMSRSQLALRAIEETIIWGNMYMLTPDDIHEFKDGLMKLAEEEEKRNIYD